MRRREFIKFAAGVTTAWPLTAHALPRAMPVVGILSPEGPKTGNIEGLFAGLRELGYVEGRNITFEYRWANGSHEKLPELAEDLVRLRVDVIVAFVTPASLAAKRATATIPIVMVGTADPVGIGVIASLARPGGNVTGTSSIAADTVQKQFELVKEVIPGASRFAVIWNPGNPAFQTLQIAQAKAAAATLGIGLQFHEARGPDLFPIAFEDVARDGSRALVILIDPLYMVHYQALVEYSVKGRYVATMGFRPFAEAGGLMSFAPNYADQYKRSAVYVDKILKGVRPADLPVEQATKIELVVNLTTAKKLGIDIPTSILLRADNLIG